MQISLLHFRTGMGLHKKQGFLVGKKNTMLLLRFQEQSLILGGEKKKIIVPKLKKGLIT